MKIQRQTVVLVHRYLGLVMALFLLLSALTGSLLAFNDELDAAINPRLFNAPSSGSSPLSPLALRERVLVAYPQSEIESIPLYFEKDRSQMFWIYGKEDPITGGHAELANNQVFIHPYSGEILGARKHGDLSQGMVNLMPFIYRFHYSLALGDVGYYLMGLIALLWTIDCFAGIYLTFPARQRSTAPASQWLSRWWSAWTIRRKTNSYKLNFDLHRAGALWIWAMLFVLAWSAVSFNLRFVYFPVMMTAFDTQKDVIELLMTDLPPSEPKLTWQEALTQGRHLMAEQATQQGFSLGQEDNLSYNHHNGLFSYDAFSSLDLSQHHAATSLLFDGKTGAFKAVYLPTGKTSGDTINTWITNLHMATFWRPVLPIFICIMGLLVAMLSITGVYIWWKKRLSRLKATQRSPAPVPLACKTSRESGAV